MTIRRMRIACRMSKATDTDSEYVILIAFSLQPWLSQRDSVLRYTYITCLVIQVPEYIHSSYTAHRQRWTMLLTPWVVAT